MAKFKRDAQSTQLYFRCPGCNEIHALDDSQTDLRGEKRPVWEFNCDYERPTIYPSYLTRWHEWNPKTEKFDIERDRCHSFIRNGMIEFLSDCMHPLAGQTVELPEID